MGQCFPGLVTWEKTSSSNEEKKDCSPATGKSNLIRTTRYDVLNAEDHAGSELAGQVWVANVNQDEISRRWVGDYSVPNDKIDYFISHTWHDDGTSKGMPQPPKGTWESAEGLEEFGWRKAVAFQNVVRTIVEMKCHNDIEIDRKTLSFWLDKVCIPQYDDQLKKDCISSLETFITHSEGLIVLLTPRYPKRLWCVFEVACFLCSKQMQNVFVNFRSFCSNENRTTYLDLIRKFSIDMCECKVQFDRTILAAKVEQYYNSKDHFAQFVQDSLLSLIIRDLFSYPPMIKTEELFKEHVEPFLSLLKEIEDGRKISVSDGSLFEAFSSFDVINQYKSVEYRDDMYMEKLKEHLRKNVYVLLDDRRRSYCSSVGLSLYQGQKTGQG